MCEGLQPRLLSLDLGFEPANELTYNRLTAATRLRSTHFDFGVRSGIAGVKK